MTTVDQSLHGSRRRRLGVPGPARRRLTHWGPALVSITAALAYGLYIALRTYEVDLGVYLRLGGKYIFTSHLYSFVLPNTSLPFTYPPFAALLFAPWQRTFSTVGSVQTVWTMCNLAVLVGVLVLSVRLVKPSLSKVSRWRLALALSLPALLLNPVLITIGFGQVNLFVMLLVMWDLLSERRIGKRQIPPRGTARLAAAVKLTPLLFVPYLLLTRRWRGAVICTMTFIACEVATFVVSPTSSKTLFWTKAIFQQKSAGDLSIVDNQNLWSVLDRFAAYCAGGRRHAVARGRRVGRSRLAAERTGGGGRCSGSSSLRRRYLWCPPSRGSTTWCGSCRRSCGWPWRRTGRAGAAKSLPWPPFCSGVRPSGGSRTRTRQISISTRFS